MISLLFSILLFAFFVASGGNPEYFYAVAYFGILTLFVLGIEKERKRWPFSDERTKWPIIVVALLTGSMFVSSWNAHVDAIPKWTFVIPIGLMIVFAQIAGRRGWW